MILEDSDAMIDAPDGFDARIYFINSSFIYLESRENEHKVKPKLIIYNMHIKRWLRIQNHPRNIDILSRIKILFLIVYQ